jgi:HEAT repeat protein
MRSMHYRQPGLTLSCIALFTWTALAQQPQRPPQPPRPEPGAHELVTRGWALVAKGQLAEAEKLAADAITLSPRGLAPLALALEAGIARGSAPAGLDVYERWLGQRVIEEPAAVRRIATAVLDDVRASGTDAVEAFEARRAMAEDGDRAARAELAARLGRGGLPEARALAALGDKAGVEVLLQDLDSPGNPLRTLQALGQSGSQAAAPAIAARLNDPRSEVRGAAAEALGRIGGPEASATLRPLLTDPSMHVRVKAASALLRLNDASGEPVFKELLDAAGESAPSRLVAAEAMAVRPDAAWEALVRGLLDDGPSDVRLAAARLLAPRDPAAAGRTFSALQQDPNPAIREEAARVAVSLERDLTVLRRALRSADALTRVRAADRILQLTR